ncbi:Uncharacterized protein family UPF0497 [Macleaya cordata]|uniref:CASP-like protein n=1 Tax=Macleaya cordata TaxID=56857 RepID=A0A200QE22_MACCD|nr:Uncharacterized protein family UPF0497 [Macleaya cordata]
MAISKSVLISILVLRILALGLLAGSIVVLATNNFTLSDGTKTSFKDIIAYRYVIATGLLGFLYILLQIPFALYHVCAEKRLIRNGCLPQFDFYGDKIISLLLATGVGVGFGVTFEFKKLVDQFFQNINVPGVDESKSKTEKFLDKGNLSTGLLFLGFLCVAVLSVLTSINRTATTSRGLFG